MPLETASFISDLVETNPADFDPVSQGDDHLRLIKSVLKNTFPNINGEVTATDEQLNNAAAVADGVTASVAELNTLDGLTANTDDLNLFDGAASGGDTPIVPSGFIGMWSGSASSIPNGWVLCDGTNGTPDLRDRFIVGAGDSYNPGNTGGENSVTLALAHIPSHRHYVSGTTSTATLTGRLGVRTGVWRADGVFTNNQVSTADRGFYDSDENSEGLTFDGTHNHSFAAYTTYRGGGAAHENRPPYYALCFIMKT